MEDKLPDMTNIDPSDNPNQNQDTTPDGVLKAVDQQFDDSNNGKIEDISDIFTSPPKVNQPEKSADPTELDKIQQELEKTEKAYSESSKDGIKMATERNRYAPFIPLLEKMRQDPNLVAYVDDYLKTGGAPKNVVEKLGLPEDFVYDADEALKDPNSDSAKAQKSIIDTAIDSRFDAFKKEQRFNLKRATEEQQFRNEMKFDDKQWKDFSTYANDKIKSFTYEDMHYLYNREEREKNIAKTASKETLAQLDRAKQLSFPAGQGIVPMPDVSDEFKWFSKHFGDPRQKQDDVLIQ